MRRWPPFICAVLFLSAAPAQAGIPGLAVRLDYTRAAGAERCPDEHGVRDFLTGEFGYDPVQPDAGAGLTIFVTRVNRAFHVDIRLEDSSGSILWQEGFEEGDCAALIEQAALKAYIEVSTRIGAPSAAPSPAPEASLPEAPTAPAAPPARAASPAPPARPPDPAPAVVVSSPFRFIVGVQTLVHVGITPTASAGGALSAELRWGAVGIGLEGRVSHSLVPREFATLGARRIPVHSLLAMATVAPCYHAGPFVACAVVDVGSLQFRGDSRTLVDIDQLVIAAGLRPGFQWTFGRRFALTGNVEVSGIVRGFGAVVNHLEIWQSSNVFAAFGAGVNADVTDLIFRNGPTAK